MIYVAVRFKDDIESKMKQVWDAELENYLEGIRLGIAESLRNLPLQFEAILRREGYHQEIDVAVELCLSGSQDRSRLSLNIYIVNRSNNKLLELVRDVIFHTSLIEARGQGPAIEVARDKSRIGGMRLASDLARDGLTREMRQRIAQIGKVLRGLDYPHTDVTLESFREYQ